MIEACHLSSEYKIFKESWSPFTSFQRVSIVNGGAKVGCRELVLIADYELIKKTVMSLWRWFLSSLKIRRTVHIRTGRISHYGMKSHGNEKFRFHDELLFLGNSLSRSCAYLSKKKFKGVCTSSRKEDVIYLQASFSEAYRPVSPMHMKLLFDRNSADAFVIRHCKISKKKFKGH